ncbi:hypothetical protein GEMRC1_001360 [Eukaryota sp. GEM-RC1]
MQIDVLETALNRELMHFRISTSASYDAGLSAFDITLTRKDKSRSFYVSKIEFDYSDEGAVFYSSKWLSSHSFDLISSGDVCSQSDDFSTLLDDQILEVLKPSPADVSTDYSIISETDSSIKILGVVSISKGTVSNQVSVNLEVDQCSQFAVLEEAKVSVVDYFDSTSVEVHSLQDESHVSNKIKDHVSALFSSDLTVFVTKAGQDEYTVELEVDPLSAYVTITPVLSLSHKGQELLDVSEFLSTITVPEFYVDDLNDESLILDACQSVLIDSFSESLTVPFTLEYVDIDNVNVILPYEDINLSTQVSLSSIVLTEAGTHLNNVVNLLKSHDLQLTQCYCHFELKTYSDLIVESIRDFANVLDLFVEVEYSEQSVFNVLLHIGRANRHTSIEFSTTKSCPFSLAICDNLKSLYIPDYKWINSPVFNTDSKIERLSAHLSSSLRSHSLSLDSVDHLETVENSRNGRFCQSRDHFDITVSNASSDRYVIITSTMMEAKTTRLVMFWVWGTCITLIGYVVIFSVFDGLFPRWFSKEKTEEHKDDHEFTWLIVPLGFGISAYVAYEWLSRHYCSQ